MKKGKRKEIAVTTSVCYFFTSLMKRKVKWFNNNTIIT